LTSKALGLLTVVASKPRVNFIGKSIPCINPSYEVGVQWGIDQPLCPTPGILDTMNCQIPCIAPPYPGVGNNIDRCITVHMIIHVGPCTYVYTIINYNYIIVSYVQSNNTVCKSTQKQLMMFKIIN